MMQQTGDLAKGYLKAILAIGMLALSGFVLIFTFRGRYTSHVWLPSLIPVFGVKFGLIYILFQIGYCYYLCRKKAFWWMGWTLAGMFVFAWIGSTGVFTSFDVPDSSLSAGAAWGACVSAIVLGIGVLKGEL